MDNNLSELLFKLKRGMLLDAVKTEMEEDKDPIRIIRELQVGMDKVGESFKRGDYFLSELMLSADLFTQVMNLLGPELQTTSQLTVGKMVIGTLKGDIHDIGKDIFINVAKASGFEILDLGVDVPPERFVDAVEQLKPDILGFSALITTTFKSMKVVVDSLVERGLREQVKIIIGGGVTTDMVREYAGADAQTIDAMEGLDICKRFVGVEN